MANAKQKAHQLFWHEFEASLFGRDMEKPLLFCAAWLLERGDRFQ
jgi:hypothetical protein